MLSYGLIVGCAFLAIASSLQLPKYIVPCNKKDPNLDSCVLKSAKAALPFITAGDKGLKLPNLDPLKISSIDVDTGENLKLTLKELDVSGLKEAEFISFKVDLEKHFIHAKLHVDKLNFFGKYDINGHILVLPISGSGGTNITFVDGIYDYDLPWKLIKIDGVDFAKIDETKLQIKMKRAYFHFENLFGGDKTLGDNMNAVLNDNWEDVLKEIGVGIFRTIDIVITDIIAKILEQIPYDQLIVD